MTGLIVGSIAPDFEYFLRMRIKSEYSHTLLGAIWFCLPVSILISFLFHDLIKKEFLDNLPIYFKRRFTSLLNLDWNTYFKNNWYTVVISILIGVFSHILWDGFTHQTGYFVTQFEFLRSELIVFPLWKVLQHLSTLIGFLIIFYSIHTSPINYKAKNNIHVDFWIMLFFFFLSTMAFRWKLNLQLHEYGNIIVSIISSLLVSLIITTFLLKFAKRNR